MPINIVYEDNPDSDIVMVMSPETAIAVYVLMSCGVDLTASLKAQAGDMLPPTPIPIALHNLQAVATEFIDYQEGETILDSLKAEIDRVMGTENDE